MDPIEFPESFGETDLADLTALREQAFAAFTALVEGETPSAEDVAEATRLRDGVKAIDAELAAREAETQRLANEIAALRGEFSEEAAEEETTDEAVEEDEETEDEEVEEEAEAEAVVAAAKKPAARKTLSSKIARPKAPEATGPKPVTITAAADVPEFSNGQSLSDWDAVGSAVINRMRGFGAPSGTDDGGNPNWQHYGVAKFQIDFPDELTVKPHGDDMSVLNFAANEKRLEGKSLTAAGGWCAPSETLYDLCVLETLDGILSVPEVNVSRGGIKFTKGPQWSDMSTIGFTQTEAQAISGTTKPTFDITCPTFTEIRLDAIGVNIRVPILTQSAYPELVSRILQGAMVIHAHRVNAAVIGKMVTAAGSAVSGVDYGASTESLMSALALYSGIQRTKYKMALDESMEVVLPYWVKDVLREDIAQRGGRPLQAVTDEYINSEFAARRMNPQFVYDWQELATDGSLSGWPATFQVLMYPAGTFVKGVSDVISLNAIYDAASLSTNVYTGLFFEQGLLVANLCNEARLINVPMCASGKTGAQTSTACGVDV